MYAAEGIVTARGGRTSHAAVVAVGMGKACVVGASEIAVDEHRRVFEVGGRHRPRGRLDLRRTAGRARSSSTLSKTVEGELGDEVQELLAWADRYRKEGLGVRANADTPEDAQRAREFGAEGIGLVRTEHMFFAADRIPIVREMIMAADQRRAAPRSRSSGRSSATTSSASSGPWTAAGDDPSPRSAAPRVPAEPQGVQGAHRDARAASRRSDQSRGAGPPRALIASVEKLREANPMLGHRGCRLGITHPEIYGMQVRAIMEAACTVASRACTPSPRS
jgi:pyruvate,orthophosphate dikinase